MHSSGCSVFCSNDYGLGVVVNGDRSVAVRIDIDGILAEVVPCVAAMALDLDLRTFTGRSANLYLDALGFAIALAGARIENADHKDLGTRSNLAFILVADTAVELAAAVRHQHRSAIQLGGDRRATGSGDNNRTAGHRFVTRHAHARDRSGILKTLGTEQLRAAKVRGRNQRALSHGNSGDQAHAGRH